MKHILIVEDLDEHAFLLQTQLNRLNLLTSICTDMFQIMRKINSGAVDAVTIDINLPEINGIEVLRHIRKINKKILIVMITAVNNEAARIETMQLGANYYLVKPYSKDELRAVFNGLKNEQA